MNIIHIQSPKLYSIHSSELLPPCVIRSFGSIYDHMPIQISSGYIAEFVDHFACITIKQLHVYKVLAFADL